MPCYDKKLEASRSDFYNDILRTRDVDCVIATVELEALLKDKDIDLTSAPASPLDSLSWPGQHEDPVSHAGSGSVSGFS